MATPRVLIVRTAGTNCDLETEYAWQLAGAAAERMHLRRLIERPALLREYDILTIPGGFSYGDDVAAGKILALQLQRHLGEPLREFIDEGKFVLGICNGFQALVKAGLLPFRERTQASSATHSCTRAAVGAAANAVREVPPIAAEAKSETHRFAGALQSAAGCSSDSASDSDQVIERDCTIAFNHPPGFQDRWVHLRAEPTPCVFLEPGRIFELPIAHGEGRVLFAGPAAARRAAAGRHIALRYAEPPASTRLRDGPMNPNGSALDIAGLCDETGRVFGLMPHPERFVAWTQHPLWTSLPPREQGDGLAIFRRALSQLG